MEFGDNELISMICENSEDVKDALYEKYGYIVNIILSKYKRTFYALGLDKKEATQEALLGFSDALVTYHEQSETSLSTFISLCIERKILNYIRKETTLKKKFEKNNISLDIEENEGKNLLDYIGDIKYNPLDLLEESENYKILQNKIEESLSPSEKDVYKLLINGFKYNEISEILQKDIKQIYNTIQRIRSKIKDIVEIN